MTLDLDHYRALLLQRRADLQQVAQTGDEAAATVELDQTRVGRLSRMDALQGQAMSQETRRRREQELRLITAALQRLDAGEYGECVQCGEPIAEGRLAINPAVSLCIRCAEGQAEE
jgi:DnaK suppressor protein